MKKSGKYKKYKIDKTNQVKINYLIEDNNQIENYYQIKNNKKVRKNMKMPEKIDTIMFAPCGMNCNLCIKHVNPKNPCPGCQIDSPNKTKNALKCKIKKCLESKRVKYCGRCSEFPCKLIKKQDKNYKKRYNFSTLDNAKRITYTGINKIMLEDKLNWQCKSCGGIISIQEHICSECGLKDDDE